MKKLYVWYILFALGIVSLFSWKCSFTGSNDDQYWEKIHKNYHIYAPPLPQELDFAGEDIPLEYFDVRESLDKELLKIMFWHSETILYIKRAPRFFPVVEPVLKKYGIPEDFKYLLVAESGMSNVTSPAGAAGYWQFMEKTAKKYGLIVNSEVDQRYDIYLSTEAACKYLRDAYNHYGSWILAAASYNVGQTNLDRAIKRQGTDNFFDLALNVQTARYLYRILAFKLIMSDPQKYGFYVREQDKYKPIKTKVIKVDTSVPSWIDFAREYGTNYKLLLLLNPWIKDSRLSNPDGNVFYVRVPEQGARITD